MKFIMMICLSAMLTCVAKSAEIETPKVIVKVTESVDDVRKLIYPAQINAKVQSTVTADLEGTVKKILKPLGAHVKRGEIIMVLENQDPAFTYAAVPFRAPVSGVLSQIGFPLMSKALKGDKLFSIVGLDTLRIQIEVPSSEINYLAAGTEGHFKPSLEVDKLFPVSVAGVSPVVDPRSGTAAAELEFSNKKKKNESLLPAIGTVGQVTFESILGKVILVPEAALKYVEGIPGVWFIDEKNKAHRRALTLGSQRGEVYLVKSGLKPGERYVLRSDKRIRENIEVEIEKSSKDGA